MQKVGLSCAALLFAPLSLFGNTFLENDFRDYNATYHFQAHLDAKSNKLAFNTFEQEWIDPPPHKEENRAFGNLSFSAFISLESWRIGAFNQKISQIFVNDGFIQTWHRAEKDFWILLGMSDINQQIGNVPIEGDGVYISSSGLFLQKVLSMDSKNHFAIKTKLHIADDLQSIKASGLSTDEKFEGSFDYYYAEKNFISKRSDRDDSKGLGYSVDVEYIYDDDTFYFYLGAFNLHSFIYYKDVTLMHYDFDSETIYVGEDGYNHYKPFGVGYYKENSTLKQKIPHFYKSSFNYVYNDQISLGNNLDLYDGVYYNEPYVNVKIGNGRYKVGCVIENQEFVFGAYFKNLALGISNSFGLGNDMIAADVKLRF